MPQPIPEYWCKQVVAALKTHDSKIIEWAPQAFHGWHHDTFGDSRFDAHRAIISCLTAQCVFDIGNVHSQEQQAATYEFLFRYGTKDMHCKIALRTQGVRIQVLSAHKAKQSL